jgi:hypothetical protein
MFIGTFAADQMPTIQQYPCAFVVNLDPKSKPGSHWMAYYFTADGQGEYFDSYGQQPIGRFLTYLKKNCDGWVSSNTQVQNHASSTCGQYCIMFIYFRARGISMKQFLSYFSSRDFAYNDSLVVELVSKCFHASTDVYDEAYLISQISTLFE